MSRPRSFLWTWWIIGLLLLATTINYMDRVTLSNAAVRVKAEFALTDKMYGNLEVVFGLAFAAGSLVFGFLADRLKIYWLYPCVLAGWSLMGMLSGWTQGYTSLLVCRGLLGFFEAGHWPCALKTTFALLSEKDRTMGNSVLQSGASIGAIITPQVMKLLMTDEAGSWRHAFVVVGGVGLLWVAVWLVCLRPRDLAGPETPAQDASLKKEPAAGLAQVLLSRPFWAVALLIFGAQTVWHMFRVWLPLFLQKGRDYTEATTLDFTTAYYLSTDAGCFLAGLAALWLVRKLGVDPHHARRRVYAGACVLTSLSLAIPWLGQGWLLLGVLLLIGAGALALFPCYYSFVQDISTEHVGRLTGILSMWVWLITSPLHNLFGWLADTTHSYDLGLAIAGLVPWLGVISMSLLWKRGASGNKSG